MATDPHDLTTELTAGAGSSPAPPRVVALWKGGSVSRFLKTGARLTLGRGRDCDLIIDHPSVSRMHAVILAGPPLQIEDHESANGTRVAGVRIPSSARFPLSAGQAVSIGVAVVIVHGDLGDRASDANELDRTPGPRSRPGGTPDDGTVIAEPAMKAIYALAARVAPSTLPIVLLGQTGVGKDVLAEAIHRRSARKGPLLRLNCAAVPPALLESELFGFERGAFTGAGQAKPGLVEAADGGTLFLDEIAELHPAMQAKLLHVLERGEVMRLGALRPRAVDVRFLAATNRDLDALVAEGAFRADLYYRLHGMSITIPPLAERRSEIAPLARLFVARASEKAGQATPAVAPEAMAVLERHTWPGNVRELRNVMERATALCEGDRIEIAHLPAALLQSRAPSGAAGREAPLSMRESVQGAVGAIERQRIVDALARTAGNQSAAATLLGISRRTLVARLGEYDIPRPLRRR